ncbi:hypothetical protein U1Q18_033839 [Sarracenia purpurea var. burkii]
MLEIGTGFVSLSCGGSAGFVDSHNITWVSDDSYVTVGNTSTIDFAEGGSSSSQLPLRFFPNSPGRKCYRLPLKNLSSSVLVRTRFVYKNYDGLAKPPAFSVSLGTAISTTTINLTNSDPWTEEFIWTQNKEILPLCLQPIPNSGFPVISTLEVRPLPQGAYKTGFRDFPNKFLRKSYRINCGYNNGSLRYPLDPYDRIWDADQDFSPFRISTGFKIQSTFNLSSLKEIPPASVLQTARVLTRKDVLTYNLPLHTPGDYYIILYFAGILPVFPSFDVLINGDIVQQNFTVKRSEVSALFITRKGIKSLNITIMNISFCSQINAIEVYEIVDIPPESSSTTVSALQVIQQSTGLDLGWQDDPCSPTPWDHVGCEGNFVTSLELSDITLRSIGPTFSDLLDLTTLDLHNTSLAGEIQNVGSLQHLEKLNLSFNQLTSFGLDLEDLISLQILDLQNNNLQGIVPDSLGELKELHLLNLENNKLQGTLPQALNRESLEVRMSGNLCLSFSLLTCNGVSSNPSIETPEVTVFTKKKHKFHKHLAIVLGAIGGALLTLFIISLSVFLYIRRNKSEAITYKARAETGVRSWSAAKFFSSKEIKAATNNFKEVIGRGSFGSVYLGKLPDGKLVAVKVRFDKTQLGADSFINEMNAKVCDFGLSKQVTQADATHVTTVVKGTAGYLDPEYYSSQQLTEKSDVYSFGVVLLELICGREPLSRSGTPDSFNLVLWAKPYLQAGAFEIVDESVKGTFDVESMRKAAFIASRCVERDGSRRPAIAEVLGELKEAYCIQLSYLASSGHVS